MAVKVLLPGSAGGMKPLQQSYRGPGLRVRFRRIRGVTARGVLSRELLLPVILGEFTVDEEFLHSDYDTVSAGEFSTPAAGGRDARQLRTTDLETLTIDWHRYARWLTNPHVTPARVRRELTAIGRAKTPFEILVLDPHGKGESVVLRMKATIRSKSETLKPGEADTRYYTIEIKEWRDNSTRRRAHGDTWPKKHRLTRTDAFYSLSKRYYAPPVTIADGARLIAARNKVGVRGSTFGGHRGGSFAKWGMKDPLVQSKLWRVGDVILIPEPDWDVFDMNEMASLQALSRVAEARSVQRQQQG